MHNSFSIKRLGLLLRRDLRSSSRIGPIVVGVGFVILFLTFYFSLNNEMIGYRNGNPNFNYANFRTLIDLFIPLFLITGFVFTSIAFLDLVQVPKAQAYLSLPTTTFEKWLSKWLLTAIGFPLAFLLLYQLFSWLCFAVGKSMGVEIVTLNFFDPFAWKLVFYYLIFQSIFLLGAVSMPKVSFFKTLAIGIGILFGVLFIANLTLWMVKPELADTIGTWQFDFVFPNWGMPSEQHDFLSNRVGTYLLGLFAFLFFPMLSFISYLKLKEKEV